MTQLTRRTFLGLLAGAGAAAAAAVPLWPKPSNVVTPIPGTTGLDYGKDRTPLYVSCRGPLMSLEIAEGLRHSRIECLVPGCRENYQPGAWELCEKHAAHAVESLGCAQVWAYCPDRGNGTPAEAPWRGGLQWAGVDFPSCPIDSHPHLHWASPEDCNHMATGPTSWIYWGRSRGGGSRG